MRLTVMLLAVLLLLPAAARADDADVFAAYQKGTRAERKAEPAYERAAKAKAPKRIIRADRRINRALRLLDTGLRSAHPSTRDGREAKRLLLRRDAFWRRANHLEMRAWDLYAHRHYTRAHRISRHGAHLMRHKTAPTERAAFRRLRAAGFKP